MAGIENVVASLRTSMSDQQIQFISRFAKNVVTLFDGDLTGIKAALRGADLRLPDSGIPGSGGRSRGFLRVRLRARADLPSRADLRRPGRAHGAPVRGRHASDHSAAGGRENSFPGRPHEYRPNRNTPSS